jgi:hypothetical protein
METATKDEFDDNLNKAIEEKERSTSPDQMIEQTAINKFPKGM